MAEKRKAYTTIDQQMAADKRYLKRNPEARENKSKMVAKSSCKRYILKLATLDELEEVKSWIAEREKR